MKYNFKSVALFATAILTIGAFSACSNEIENIDEPQKETKTITFTATLGEDDPLSRTSYEEVAVTDGIELKTKWKADDVLYVGLANLNNTGSTIKPGDTGSGYVKATISNLENENRTATFTITPDETASIYDTGTILTSSDKVIVLKDATETKNHFTLFKYMLDTIEEKLSEDMIKKFHFILKDGTLTDSEKEWFNVGDYKKRKNFVGNITTTLPKNVDKDMKDLLNWYEALSEKKLEDIIEFHVRFEKIHPFQDGNGRVGRMIMFRECLYNDIMPFFIEERNKDFYLRGIKEYQTNNEKGYLIDTCLNSQDNYEKLVNYFLEDDDN